MRMQPSAVDWTEFSVWCFALADVAKLEKRQFPATTATQTTASVTSAAPSSGDEHLPEVFGTVFRHRADSFTRMLADGRRRLGQAKRNQNQTLTSPDPGQQTTMPNATSVAQQSPIRYVYAQFAAGAIGGGTATYSTHWLDTIKVKMQMYPGTYSSGTSCFKQTLRTEGLRGLYLGATPALVGQMSKTSVVFLAYGICEQFIATMAGFKSSDQLSPVYHASAGAMAGIASSFVLCPLELVKCRLQAMQQVATVQPVSKISPLCIAREVVRNNGLRGLYRGLPGIWTKDVPGSFIYFGSYEAAKSCVRIMHGMKPDETKIDIVEVFMCGMLAGLCYCITHPIETVKTRVQVQPDNVKRQGFIRTFAHIARTEGLTPLCSGLKPSLLRASMFSGVQFVTYELARNYFLYQ